MIEVTKLNNISIIINSDLIQSIEETPDTVLTLTNGVKYVIKESAKDVTEKVISFRRKIHPFIEPEEKKD